MATKAEVQAWGEWFARAIVAARTLRKESGGQYADALGVHSVFQGINEAFRASYPDADPIEAQKACVAAGLLQSRPAPRGASLLLPGESAPSGKATTLLVRMKETPTGS